MASKLFFAFSIGFIVFCISFGCKKIKTPFSADPIQPAQSKLDVFITDNGTPVPNLTVKAVDPAGNNFTTITDSMGLALLNPVPFHFGNWAVQVPTQGKYYASSMNVSMPDGVQDKAVTFQANPPVLNVIPTSSSYPYGGGSVTYTVEFQSGGNLNVLDVLSVPMNAFPSTTWTSQLFPSLLGEPGGKTSAEFVVNIPNCSYQQPVFQVLGSDNDGANFSSSNSVTVTRGYVVKATLTVRSLAHAIGTWSCGNNFCSGCWLDIWEVNFSTDNDCGIPWDITVSYNYPTVNSWELANLSGCMNSGSSYTIKGVTSGTTFTLRYIYSSDKNPVGNSAVSSVIGSGSNNGTVNASWDF